MLKVWEAIPESKEAFTQKCYEKIATLNISKILKKYLWQSTAFVKLELKGTRIQIWKSPNMFMLV